MPNTPEYNNFLRRIVKQRKPAEAAFPALWTVRLPMAYITPPRNAMEQQAKHLPCGRAYGGETAALSKRFFSRRLFAF